MNCVMIMELVCVYVRVCMYIVCACVRVCVCVWSMRVCACVCNHIHIHACPCLNHTINKQLVDILTYRGGYHYTSVWPL